MKQNTAARKYRAATIRIRASGPATLTTSGPSSAKPSANAAFSVSVKIPFADSSCGRSTMAGIIAASAGAKKVVTVDTKMLSSRIVSSARPGSSPTRIQPDHGDAAQDVRGDEDDSPIEPVDIHARDRREEHGRHQEASAAAG